MKKNITPAEEAQALASLLKMVSPMANKARISNPNIYAYTIANACHAVGSSIDLAWINVSGRLVRENYDLKEAFTIGKLACIAAYPIISKEDVEWLLGTNSRGLAKLVLDGELDCVKGEFISKQVSKLAISMANRPMKSRMDVSKQDLVLSDELLKKRTDYTKRKRLRKNEAA